MFFLIASIIAFVFGFLDGVLGTVVVGEFGLLSSIYQLGMFLPVFAVRFGDCTTLISAGGGC